jgi:hypothetical protein
MTFCSGMDDVAFGSNPAAWPLATAATPEHLWLRAVAAGGQGHYAQAHADLQALLRSSAGERLMSLAHSTRGSLWRQLGWHERARGCDGTAWALSSGGGEAGADALIGLAADALGVGRFAESQRALERAADIVADSPVGRLPVRLSWVSAELAMARGDRSAVGHAARAVDSAEAIPSVRHRVKSRLVLAAARCAAGDLTAARRDGDSALTQATEHALLPLRWAAASLLEGIGSEQYSPPQVTEIRERSAETVIRRGGVWRPR